MRSATETLLARLWADTLGVERVSATDNFFALGGHSLQAARILEAVEQETGYRLSMRAFWGAPDLRAMAATLGSGQVG